MYKGLIYSVVFLFALNGVNAQSERINLTSLKDSLSFALGVESAVGLFQGEGKLQELDRVELVKGFQSNLSNAPTTACEKTLQDFLGPYGTDFNREYLKEGSLCIGRFSGYYFYTQMDELNQLSELDLTLVNQGFKQGCFEEDAENLSTTARAGLLQDFGAKLQQEFLAEIEKSDAIFWADIKGRKTAHEIGETGIYLETIEKGTGGKPNQDSNFEAHYILTNTVGDTLENSYKNGSSLKMNLSQVIAGWREGFPAMNKGGKYRLFVPYEKAYKGASPQAPQGALCFFIEFIDFDNEVGKTNMESFERVVHEVLDETENETESEPSPTIMYQCPDDCQHGPAYFKAGPCTACGKEMIEI